MGFPILVRSHLYIELGHRWQNCGIWTYLALYMKTSYWFVKYSHCKSYSSPESEIWDMLMYCSCMYQIMMCRTASLWFNNALILLCNHTLLFAIATIVVTILQWWKYLYHSISSLTTFLLQGQSEAHSNTLKPGQKGYHFTETIFKSIFLYKHCHLLIQI